MTKLSRLPVLTASFLMIAAVGLSADDATQSVTVDNLSFKTPAAWKKVAPSNAMRKAQFRVEPAKETTRRESSRFRRSAAAGAG